jgi:hypothetical protein
MVVDILGCCAVGRGWCAWVLRGRASLIEMKLFLIYGAKDELNLELWVGSPGQIRREESPASITKAIHT